MASSGFKRHYPRIGKCICCFCLSPETSVKVCTYILLVIFAFLGYGTGYGSYTIITSSDISMRDKIPTIIILLSMLITFISLVLLLVGLSTYKIPFLKQFKIVFLIYIIYSIYNSVLSYINLTNEDTINETIKQMKSVSPNFDEEQYKKSVKLANTYSIVFNIAITLIYIYYYLTTCCVIEDIEESEYNKDDVRNLENNEY